MDTLTITKAIDEHIEVTEVNEEIVNFIADFIRAGVRQGDAEALVTFLTPAVANFIILRKSVCSRKIRIAAAERVDGFGGPTTYPILEQVPTDNNATSNGSATFVPTGETEKVKSPGLLDRKVLSKTYKFEGYGYVCIGNLNVEQHQEMIALFQKNVDANQQHIDDHAEWVNMILVSGASCVNDLV